MYRLCLALILIRAVLPVGDVKDRAEELRQVAINAGCPSPRLVMWSEDGAIHVELSCPPSLLPTIEAPKP